MYMCHSLHVEIQTQLWGDGCLRPPRGFWGLNLRSLGKGSKNLYSLKHFAKHKISFKLFVNSGSGNSRVKSPIPVA